jgi:DNA-binding GntR family transcriptional regulator
LTSNTKDSAKIDEDVSAVDVADRRLREMIARGQVSPGEHLSQMSLAQRLGVSRVPVREALTLLAADGVVTYRANHGYFVAKMSREDIGEIYAMRRLLETELYRSLAWPGPHLVERLSHLNDQMQGAKGSRDSHISIPANRRFHFMLFELSPHRLMRREVERLWAMSESYRAVYHYAEAGHSPIHAEHQRMITAVKSQDRDELIRAADEHRSHAETYVVRLLRRSSDS